MITDLIKAIATAINTEFNSEDDIYHIYTEDISQGFEEPCFSIVPVMTTNRNLLYPRYQREYSFDIHYFVKDEIQNKKAECIAIAERLFLCLEFINFVDNTYKGIKMRYEVIDGVLHFFVSYNVIVRRELEQMEKMETVKANVGLKGDN